MERSGSASAPDSRSGPDGTKRKRKLRRLASSSDSDDDVIAVETPTKTGQTLGAASTCDSGADRATDSSIKTPNTTNSKESRSQKEREIESRDEIRLKKEVISNMNSLHLFYSTSEELKSSIKLQLNTDIDQYVGCIKPTQSLGDLSKFSGLTKFKCLKNYQQCGVHWLSVVHDVPYASAILADEMGLGKTAQVCVFIEYIYRIHGFSDQSSHSNSGPDSSHTVNADESESSDTHSTGEPISDATHSTHTAGGTGGEGLNHPHGPNTHSHHLNTSHNTQNAAPTPPALASHFSDRDSDAENEPGNLSSIANSTVSSSSVSPSASASPTATPTSARRPGISVVVVPLSVLGNWLREFENWTCLGSKVVIFHGNYKERMEMLESILERLYSDDILVIIMTLGMFKEVKVLKPFEPFEYLIIDEAHSIKNPNTTMYRKLLYSFDFRHKLLLTGTPIQNTMDELCSLLQFAMPYVFESSRINQAIDQIINDPELVYSVYPDHQLLDHLSGRSATDKEAEGADSVKHSADTQTVESQAAATEHKAPNDYNPATGLKQDLYSCINDIIEKNLNKTEITEHLKIIQKLTTPFILRRLKSHVMNELPTKHSLYVPCEMEGLQLEVYQRFLSNSSFDNTPPSTNSTPADVAAAPAVAADAKGSAKAEGVPVKDDVDRIPLKADVDGIPVKSEAHGDGGMGTKSTELSGGDGTKNEEMALTKRDSGGFDAKQDAGSVVSTDMEEGLESDHRGEAKPNPSEKINYTIFQLRRICNHPLLVRGVYYTDEHIARIAQHVLEWQRQQEERSAGGSSGKSNTTSTKSNSSAKNTESKSVAHGHKSCKPMPKHSSGPGSMGTGEGVRTGRELEFEKLRNHLMSLSDFEIYNIYLSSGTLSNSQDAKTPRPLAEHDPLLIQDSLFFESAKINRMFKLLELILGRGENVLIFSQFTSYLDVIEKCLHLRGVSNYLRLDGSLNLREKERILELFTSASPARLGPQSQRTAPSYRIMLVSTKVGGIGLNLTRANNVILMDQSWNPHNDLQAEDRCHRIGQDKPVTIYKLFTRSTIEEHVIFKSTNKLYLNHLFNEV